MVYENRRSAPPRLRRLILKEQGGLCANPKCRKDHQLDWKECETNHIIPWSKGGRTVRWNLEVLCITCHRLKTKSQLRKSKPSVKIDITYEKQYKSYRRKMKLRIRT